MLASPTIAQCIVTPPKSVPVSEGCIAAIRWLFVRYHRVHKCASETAISNAAKPGLHMATSGTIENIRYVVEGGHKLAGTVEPSGNKNAALPIIAATLLTDQPVHLSNVPRIRDTETLVELIRSVGASAEWRGRNRLTVHAKHIRAADLDPDLCARIRASILLAGPLLARCGELTLPPPGGDVIGRRRLDTHVLAFEQLGATVTATDRLEFRSAGLKGADVFLVEPSVTATENALVAAVAAKGTTYLRNAASEPHVQDLAHFLLALGARIEGIGTNTM